MIYSELFTRHLNKEKQLHYFKFETHVMVNYKLWVEMCAQCWGGGGALCCCCPSACEFNKVTSSLKV